MTEDHPPATEPTPQPAPSGPQGVGQPAGTAKGFAGGPAMLVAAAILLIMMIIRTIVGSFPAAFVVTFVDALFIMGFLAFRYAAPVQASAFTTAVTKAAQNVVDALRPVANPPAGWAPQPPLTAIPAPQVPGAGGYPVNPIESTWAPPAVGGPMLFQPDPKAGVRTLVSGLSLAASMIPYGLMFNAASTFTSLWQPWWLKMSLVIALLISIAAWSRPGGNQALALLVGMAGSALYVFVTVPADDVGLQAMLMKAMSKGNMSWSTMHSMTLWAGRLPILITAIFVVAWGLARRRNPTWLLGLIPTIIAIAVAIWYTEDGVSKNPGMLTPGTLWFVQWLLAVGPFAVGCLACWLADQLAGPRQA